jgi:acyl carrier protein
MADKLLSLIASVMVVDESEVTEDSDFETLKTWDSQRELELALMLDFEFGISLGPDELPQLRSVRSVRAIIAEKGARKK